MNAVDLPLLRQWIGSERTVVDELNPFPARALAAALDRGIAPQAMDALPPGWQWLYFLDTPRAAGTGHDGHPKLDPTAGGFLPPVPLPRRMWAAGSMRLEQPLRLGRAAHRHSVIRSVDAKPGKSGPLVFVTLDHTLCQDGRVCIREEQNLVYRDMPDSAAPLPPGEAAPEPAQWTRAIAPDPVLLFRYSALTYNAHRIHYDRNYAIEQEFYPALVVQGPLLATLLLELIADTQPDRVLRDFRFRAIRPSFDTQAFTVNARRQEQALQLWTADADGLLCVSAEATLA